MSDAPLAFPSNGFREGMTLRDYFAAATIGAAHEVFFKTPRDAGDEPEKMLAKYCYEMADAMLVEREAK